MAKSGLEFKDLDKIEKKLQNVITKYPEVAKEIMGKLLLRFVGKCKKYSPFKTGLLRRSWQVGKIKVSTTNVKGEVFNNVKYALPVEKGHLTRGGKGFVQGRFMLKRSLDEMNKDMPKFVEKEIKKFIEGELK